MMRIFTIDWEVDGASGSSTVEAISPIAAMSYFYTWFPGYRFLALHEGTRTLAPVMWMAGPRPRKWLEVRCDHAAYGYLETLVAHDLFRSQCESYKAYWSDLPLGVARTFWTRARYGASATIKTLLRDTRY